jgi:broad specificity phosphatase PhoE
MSARDYLESHGVEAALAEAIASVVRERPADPLAAIGQALIKARQRQKKAGRLPSVAVAPTAKTLLLVRHGESMHNISEVAQFGDKGADSSLFDAPLSPLGETQVESLKGHSALAGVELAICSPLTRAVQTLLGAYPELEEGGQHAASAPPPPVELWPLAAEHLTDSCDIGSGASELRAKFPWLNVSGLDEVWWYTDEETGREEASESRRRYTDFGFMEPERLLFERVDAFVDRVRRRPERVIAVFGHSDWHNCLMERHAGIGDYWLENAEVYRLTLEPAAAGEDATARA